MIDKQVHHGLLCVNVAVVASVGGASFGARSVRAPPRRYAQQCVEESSRGVVAAICVPKSADVVGVRYDNEVQA